MREITYVQASTEALQEAFRQDKKYIHLSNYIPAVLRREFGEERVWGAPISESAFCGDASEIAALVAQDDSSFAILKSAPKLVTGLNIPISYSPPMEKYAVPDKTKILAAIETVLGSPVSRI